MAKQHISAVDLLVVLSSFFCAPFFEVDETVDSCGAVKEGGCFYFFVWGSDRQLVIIVVLIMSPCISDCTCR